MTKPVRRRRRRKANQRMYFTQDHEDAIVRYTRTEDNKERTELYINWIQPAFNEMVDKIVFTYKFTNLPNIDELKDECKIWLTTVLCKYDPSKGSKAFSYFSVITKNWFIHKVKQNSKRLKRDVQYEDIAEIESEKLQVENLYEHKREMQEFWQYLFSEIDSWEKLKGKSKEDAKREYILLVEKLEKEDAN